MVYVTEPYRIPMGWCAYTRGDAALYTPPGSALQKHKEVTVGDGFVLIRAGDWLVGSCYCSPNVSQGDFQYFVGGLAAGIDSTGRAKYVAIAGDYNAKSPAWGSRVLDDRGAVLMDPALEKGLAPVNSVGRATFERNGRRSKIDCVLINPEAHGRLTFSRVLADYTASDHLYLLHEFRPAGPAGGNATKWTYSLRDLDRDKIMGAYMDAWECLPWSPTGGPTLPSEYTAMMKGICEAVLTKSSAASKGGRACYWWSSEIAELRKKTNKLRRKAQRTVKLNRPEKTEMIQCFKDARKELRNTIRTNKERKWEEFCATLEKDP